ncbi:MAG TPA: hypothetical protein VHU88_23685 [Sporichthyaceae bacterium]|jgi:hypothetical protein|nr:hypothetical protein [Sporichthyaceae bacterium]
MTRLLAALTTAGVAGASVLVLTAGTARADDNRFALTAQGDSQYYQVDGEDIPGSPKNTAGSLTAQSHLDSTGQSASFAGAPYYGNSAETLPGLINGAPSQFGYNNPILPFSHFPGFVTATYPSAPEASDANYYYKVHAEAGEHGAQAAGSNGAPESIPAPNQQQSATAETKKLDDKSTVATAEGAAAGFVEGPLEVGYSEAKATITDAGGAPKVVSAVFGRFSIGGQAFGYDKAGFTYLGQSADKKAAIDGANAALSAAGLQLDIAPETTTTDPVSGVTRYVLGGMKITQNFTSPSGAKYTIGYILGRAEVASVNTATTATAVALSSTGSAATLGSARIATRAANPAAAWALAARPARSTKQR